MRPIVRREPLLSRKPTQRRDAAFGIDVGDGFGAQFHVESYAACPAFAPHDGAERFQAAGADQHLGSNVG